jgi:hypothetical protein
LTGQAGSHRPQAMHLPGKSRTLNLFFFFTSIYKFP